MSYTVIVSFTRDHPFEFKFLDNDSTLFSQEAAHQWLDQEWESLGCEPTNPVGKVLRLDKVLLVAKEAGEKRFAENGDWAHRYVRAVVAALGRDTVHVNVAEHEVG
ncbi:MAG: hypothetical protein WC100_00330 [Sterolibacterium sp.]